MPRNSLNPRSSEPFSAWWTTTADLAITEDDRDALLGFNAQREAAVARARAEAERIASELAAQAIAAINARQAAYLGRLARRLGVPGVDLARTHRLNADSLTLEPIDAP